MLILLLKLLAVMLLAIAAILFYSIFIERYIVRFPKYKIKVPNLPPSFNGFKIAHISDLHYGTLVPKWFLKRLINKVNKIEKDIVVCTGDYVLGREVPERVEVAWSLLNQLHAPQGVYSVLGNCDHKGDSERSLKLLQTSGQNLRGKTVEIKNGNDSFWLAGAGDFNKDHIPLDNFLEKIPEEACRIVLAHNPDSADSIFSERVDLMISGHTHGGQVNIPFLGAPILPVHNKNYTFGLKRSLKNELVFISKGIGWGVFPGRLNSLPEIPVLELVSDMKN